MALVQTSGLALFFYTGWVMSLMWIGVYAVTHVVYYGCLKYADRCPSWGAVRLVSVSFFVMLLAYFWMPAFLMVQEDLTLQIPAAAALGGALVFLIRRADTSLAMCYLEIASVGVAIIAVDILALARVQDMAARLVMIFTSMSLFAYFAKAMLAARKQRLEAERAARLSLQSQKMEALGQLAGGVAHDFNNILTALNGSLELYDLVEDPAERADLIRNCRETTDRAGSLVGQLMSFARQKTLATSLQDVSEVLRSTAQLGERLLPSQISFRTVCSHEHIVAQVDDGQLMTAVLNLISNARDAMPGGGEITMSCSAWQADKPFVVAGGSTLPPGRYAEISVADNGTGINEDDLPRILDPFYTTKPDGKGSGLGLSMVFGFAKQSQGGLIIDTSQTGTKVSIVIPCEPAMAPAA